MRPSPRQAGYNLVILMVLLTLLSIAIAISLPAWSGVIRREKEEELIFRGLQYAEAIRVFNIRFQRPPIRLEELIEVEPRSIRRLWKDPMTENGKWALIPLQGPTQVMRQDPAQNGQQQRQEEDPNGRDPGENGEEEDEGGFGPKKGDEVQVGPFKGVHSRSSKTSFLVFNGKDRYDEWHFTVDLFLGGNTNMNGPGGDPENQLGVGGGRVMSARWIGRPIPEFMQPRQGSGLPQDEDSGLNNNPNGQNGGPGSGSPPGGVRKP